MSNRTWMVAFAVVLGCKSTTTHKSETVTGSAGASSPADASTAPLVDATEPAVAAPDPAAPKGLVALRAALGLDGPKTPAVDPKATARFAVHATAWDATRERMDNAIRIYRITGDKLELESTTELPEDASVSMRVWRNPSEIVLLAGGKLMKVSGGKLEAIERPAAKFFKAKKTGDSKLARDEALIATASGEVWLKHCAWGYTGDEDPCTSTVYVRVLPTPVSATKAPVGRVAAKLAPAQGWTLAVKPLPGGQSGTLECQGPGGVSSKLEPKPDQQKYGFTFDTWLSHEPPIARVKEWVAGADDAVSVSRYLAGCTLAGAPDLEATFAVTGPSGFWAVSQLAADSTETATAVLWHGRTVGVIAGAEDPAFSP